MLVGRYIEFEVRDGQVFPQLLLGPVQQFRAVIPYHDGKIGTAEEVPLLHDLLLHVLELVRLRLQHGPVPSLVGAVDRHTAGELFIKFIRALEIEDLVDRMVAVQVHARAFQFRHVQAASGHGQCGVLHIASDGAVRQIVTVTDGIATRFLPVDGDLSGEMDVTVAVSPGKKLMYRMTYSLRLAAAILSRRVSLILFITPMAEFTPSRNSVSFSRSDTCSLSR